MSSILSIDIAKTVFETLNKETPSDKSISLEKFLQYISTHHDNLLFSAFEARFQQHSSLDLPGLINLSKEAFKGVQKVKMLLKSKMDKEKSKCDKIASGIKFNKYELIFILDKQKASGKGPERQVTVKVENEISNEFFMLDDKEIICKLKLLNTKEKFKVRVIETDTKSGSEHERKDYIYLDLEEIFGTENINIEKKYENYTLSIKLKINDQSQKDVYEKYKAAVAVFIQMKSRYYEIEGFVSQTSKLNTKDFVKCFNFLNSLFDMEDLGLDVSSISRINKSTNSVTQVTNNNETKTITTNHGRNIEDFSFKASGNNTLKQKEEEYDEQNSSFFQETNSFMNASARNNHKNLTEKAMNPLNHQSTNKKKLTLTQKFLGSHTTGFSAYDGKRKTIVENDSSKIRNSYIPTTSKEGLPINSEGDDFRNVVKQNNNIHERKLRESQSKDQLIPESSQKEDNEKHISNTKDNKDPILKFNSSLSTSPEKVAKGQLSKEINFKVKKVTLVDETQQKYKADVNPFKKTLKPKGLSKKNFQNEDPITSTTEKTNTAPSNKTKSTAPITMVSNNHVEISNHSNMVITNNEGNVGGNKSFYSSSVEDRLKNLVKDENVNKTNHRNIQEGSLLALINIGIRAGGVIFSSDFKVSTAYQSYLQEQSRI